MSPTKSDLLGAVRLASDGVCGVTGVVEAVHQRIAAPGRTRTSREGRAGGISGLVYSAIRGITRSIGAGASGAVSLLLEDDGNAGQGRQREAIIAALNGVLGDHLAATGNPLTTTMEFRHGGQPLTLERTALKAELPQAGEQLLVLIHGLCMNDLQWRRGDHDHGAAIAAEFGFTPIYLRYNSGLRIEDNGRTLAEAMERLIGAWPRRVGRLAMLCHSMGGLVARSAWHQAVQQGMAWPSRLDDLVFLGTPHFGAPLEQIGHLLDITLQGLPYAAPLARLSRLRSAGITDLRHGNVLAPDSATGECVPVPLPQGVRCRAVAALLGKQGGRVKSRVGDGLVPLNSALGRHSDATRSLAFAAQSQYVASETGHLDLLASGHVYAKLRTWFAAAPVDADAVPRDAATGTSRSIAWPARRPARP